MSQQRSLGTFSINADIEELRRPLLTGLCLSGLALSYLWIIIFGSGLDPLLNLPSLIPGLVLFSVCLICIIISNADLRLRSIFFLLGVGCAFLLGYLWLPSPTWLYYQSLVVTVAGLLAGPRTAFAMAVLFTLSFGYAFSSYEASHPLLEFLPSVSLLWATAFTSWLSSRSLYTALRWALNSQAGAWQAADEARDRRGQLRRALDSLKTTYAILKRTSLELETARQEAEEARSVKSRFVANISHELRTPLNVVVGFAEMLCTSPETYGDWSWPSALREDLLTIWRNAEHVLRMIDDVLDLARIEARRLPVTFEQIDPSELIRDTLVSASSLFRDSALELRVSLDGSLPLLNLDSTRIRQVLLNLINNAVRFTASGYIEIGAYPKGEDVIVYVRDTGEGIAAGKLDLIFQEFEQADTSIQRVHHGAGLGLAISRHLISLHGGRIWAESEVGKGSIFYFSLPVPKEQTAILPAELRRTQASGMRAQEEQGTIVALCRDPLVLRMLERHLDNLRVLAANTASEAISFVRHQHPQAIVVAADTPTDLSEASASAQVVLNAVAPIDLPVLACSFPTERRAGLSLGVSEFLIKPVTNKDVVAAIRRICERPRRVLIADDDVEMGRLLGRIIEQEWEPMEILLATSGNEALRLAEQRPDVIMLDLLMPGMSGIEVIQVLRKAPITAAIPVMVITARGPAEDLATLRQGELCVLKNSSFTASELIRVLQLVTKELPPRYVVDGAVWQGTPEAEPA